MPARSRALSGRYAQPKLADVARRAGVSLATASRALNGHESVDGALRRRVEAAAGEVGYRPNAAGRSLRTQRTQTIGMVIPSITNPHFTAAVQAAQDAAAEAGYTTIVTNASRDPSAERRDLLALTAGRVDGLLLAPTQISPIELISLLRDGPPVVLVDRRIADAPWDWVAVDVAAGVRAAVSHLVARGRRRIGLVAGPTGISTAEDKLSGFLSGVEAEQLTPDAALVVRGDYTEAGGFAATHALLGRRHPPDAIIAANNLSAIGMTRAVAERGLRVPQDVALVGFDDTSWTTLVRPSLTVVAQPVEQLGATAAELLVHRLRGNSVVPGSPEQVLLAPELIIRESTGP